jgi:murein L,D-transpeptidase YcbB/YkuD
MTKKFTPITIAVDTHAQSDYTRAVEAKKNASNALFNYLQQFVSIENKDAFEGKIYQEFIQRFSDKHFANYPTLKIEKILDLHDCRSHQVEALIKAFEDIKIEWNLEKNEPQKEQCFDIKTEYQNQNDRYDQTQQLITALETIKGDRHIYLADVVRGLNGIVSYDFSTQKIVPNIAFVLGQKERQTY